LDPHVLGSAGPQALPSRPTNCQFGADDRFQAGRPRGFMEAWSAIHAVAIEQCKRRISEIGGSIDERFGQRRTLEKTEGGSGVEFDVRRGHSDELATTEDIEDTDSVSSVVDRYQSIIASINHASVSQSRKIR
jgi:hypothetical protein